VIGMSAGVQLDRLAPVSHVGARPAAPSTDGLGAGAGGKEENAQDKEIDDAQSRGACAVPARSTVRELRVTSVFDHGPVTPEPRTWIWPDEKSTTTRKSKPPSKTR
jgi:hypothetical protein